MTITSNTSAPLVVVVGSTGNQGGSVINHLAQSDKPYRIRGLTRDVTKPAAESLKKQGVEMVAVALNVGNTAEVEKAFEGANVVFAVTNFWEHMDVEREVGEGKLMVDAAKAADVSLFIWSGLENVTEGTGGKYTKVLHFDGKAAVTKYAMGSGLPTVDVEAGFYMTNFSLPMMAPTKLDDGSYLCASMFSPNTKLPMIDTKHDYGLFVREAIESDEYNKGGKTIFAVGEWITLQNMIDQLAKITGKKIAYKQLTAIQQAEILAKTGMPPNIVEDFVQSFAHQTEYGYYGCKDTEPSRRFLARPPRTWTAFVNAFGDWDKVIR